MFRPFMKVPSPLLEAQTRPDSPPPSQLLSLPDLVLDIVFDELDVLDRCSLALTCKQLLVYAAKNEQLDYIIYSPPKFPHLQRFFQRQLALWVPSDLRYCSDCGKFVSTDPLHWRNKSEKRTRELTGRVSQLWRERREDGWLRYWIERWCDDGQPQEQSSTAQVLKHEDTTHLVCPRCAVISPDANEWRLKTVNKRNARKYPEAARGEKELVERMLVNSPGFNSPRRQESISQISETIQTWI